MASLPSSLGFFRELQSQLQVGTPVSGTQVPEGRYDRVEERSRGAMNSTEEARQAVQGDESQEPNT